MALEDPTYISDLVPDWPVGQTDFISQGDDHLRGIKKSLQNTWPNINGEVTGTPAGFNNLTNGISWVDNSAAGTPSYFQIADPINNDSVNPAPISIATPDATQYCANTGFALTWKALQDMIYPVKRVIVTSDSRNPADYLGFGTWEQRSGVIYGTGSAPDQLGNEQGFASGSVTGDWRIHQEQIITSNVSLSVTTDTAGGHVHGIPGTADNGAGDSFILGETESNNRNTAEGGEHSHTGQATGTIGTNEWNFIQPGYAFYFWERTA
ncbi:phage baseplate protein [Klebsiella michiganensis]|uniref:phage baseplate protein n=1 Tax=Klebsiella michiganensis TaxID=1134687 RepID=UPI00255A7E86|nr:hypothetical protein [Klebsiella michiganensis]MDL4446324.1 hypothetical protein [Klebsiella michiganensis]MDL4490880.1 hypothetical protein [Klebsiella michiganensis]MDL4659623.1 hypothetical protein [Klebsiella michiganensis]